MAKKRPAASVALMLSMFILVGKLFGFVKEAAIAATFGASAITDAFYLAMTVFAILTTIFEVSTQTYFVPIYTRVYTNHGQASANRLITGVLFYSGIFALLLIVIGQLIPLSQIGIAFNAFSPETLKNTQMQIKIILVALIFAAWYYTLREFLVAKEKYFISQLSGIPQSIILIIGCILYASGFFRVPEVLAMCVVVSFICQFLMLLIVSKKYFSIARPLNHPELRNIIRMVLPSLIAIGAQNIGVFVDQMMAARLGEGNVSALAFASRLTVFATALVISPFITVLYPKLSQHAASSDRLSLNSTLKEGLVLSVMIMLPISLLTSLFSKDIIHIIYARGNFDAYAGLLTSQALMFYALSFSSLCIVGLVGRASYAVTDIKSPTIIGVISIIINIILNIVLSRIMGIGGIALATSIAHTVNALLILYVFNRKYGPLGLRQLFGQLFRIALSSAVCVATAWGTSLLMPESLALVRFVFGAGAGLLVYGIMLLIFNVYDIRNVLLAYFRNRK